MKTKRQTFNLTNEKIEWARWTWNPVTGCKHGCPYCYARDIAEPASKAFPHGFEPVLREERLTAPRDMGSPEDHLLEIVRASIGHEPDPDELATHGSRLTSAPGYKTVFAVSMGDLFGEWVPQDWIERVFDAVREGPDWNFLFLTKNPERMVGLDFPDNAWAGTTVDCQERVARAQDAFAQVKAPVRFVSCEPMTSGIVFDDMTMFEWCIIGGRSRSRRAPEAQPTIEQVTRLVNCAREAGLPVYHKPNLRVDGLVASKEYPQAVRTVGHVSADE